MRLLPGGAGGRVTDEEGRGRGGVEEEGEEEEDGEEG